MKRKKERKKELYCYFLAHILWKRKRGVSHFILFLYRSVLIFSNSLVNLFSNCPVYEVLVSHSWTCIAFSCLNSFASLQLVVILFFIIFPTVRKWICAVVIVGVAFCIQAAVLSENVFRRLSRVTSPTRVPELFVLVLFVVTCELVFYLFIIHKFFRFFFSAPRFEEY